MARKLVPLGPWRGSVTTREKIALKEDELGPDSIGWLISPEDGRLIRRGGSTIQIDTLAGTPAVEVSGVLETPGVPAGANMRASQFVALHSPSAPTYEIPSWLVVDETNALGTLAWINQATQAFTQLGKGDFNQTSSGHYRQDGGAGEVRMKAVPYVDASGNYGRFHSIQFRQYPFAGSRRVMELDSGVYSPGYSGAPYWWNKRYNISGTTGTERFRARPWMLEPPLWAPPTTTPTSTVTGYSWVEGDTFWECWAFKYADGSIGPPFRCSPTATTPAKGGLVTLGTVPGTTKYAFRRISNIPIGPKGPIPVVARVGFRTAKINRAATTDANPSPDTFYTFALISDNVTTTYDDYAGSDENLTTLPSAFFDQTAPPRAQGAVAIDGRTCMWGGLRPNPFAIIIAPTGTTATRDLNLDDETAGLYPAGPFYHVKIDGSNLYLKKTTTAPATTSVTIDFATYNTLGKIVDRINESTVLGLGGTDIDEWSAQLVPGVDPNTASTALRPTTDTGDEDSATVNTAPVDATTLNVRAYCPTYPFIAALTEAYLGTFPTDNTGIWLSQGASATGDGVYSQFRIAPGHRKQPPGSSTGKVVGVEPCTGPNGVVAIVFYERARYALRNLKSGGSRDNPDYHLVPLDLTNGCVSHLSCFSGPGFAGCFGLDGVWATEGQTGTSIVISRDHLDEFPAPGQLAGDLSFAAKNDAFLSAAGSMPFTWVGVLGDKIRIRYRKDLTHDYCEHGMDYWFGRGEKANGLACLYRDDGSLYGWSAPERGLKVGVHGIVNDSTGGSTPAGARRILAWQETNAGTNDGRVEEVDKNGTADDNGTDFTSSAFMACVVAGDFEEFGLLEADPMWRTNNSTLSWFAYLDSDRSTATSTLTLAAGGSNVMSRKTYIFEANARGNLQAFEIKLFDAGDGSGACEVRKFPVIIDVTKAETRYAS